jgi:hypothetical protein
LSSERLPFTEIEPCRWNLRGQCKYPEGEWFSDFESEPASILTSSLANRFQPAESNAASTICGGHFQGVHRDHK